MVSEKKEKTASLTDADRKFIQAMKKTLKESQIPRDQWAKIIQKDLKQKKRTEKRELAIKNKLLKKKVKKTGIRGAFQRLGNNVQRSVVKKVLKKQGNFKEEDIDRVLDMIQEGGIPQDGNFGLPNLIPETNISDVNRHGMFLTEEQDKSKKMVDVFFDDFDD